MFPLSKATDATVGGFTSRPWLTGGCVMSMLRARSAALAFERTIWSIAALVKELPAMTPERYASLGERARGDGHGDSAEGGGAQGANHTQ